MGANVASGFGSVTGIGTIAWTSPPDAQYSDNLNATAGTLLGVLASAQTNYLEITNLNFSVPAAATICGIQVNIERHAAGLLVGSSVVDNSLLIMKNGSRVGTNHASGAGWPGTDAVASYGNNADLWGVTWTPADVNASNFGVTLSSGLNAGLASLFLTAVVDQITVTVFYNVPLPVELNDFAGSSEQHTVQLHWETLSETNNWYFDVQKQENGSWSSIAEVPGIGNSSAPHLYTAIDETPEAVNYYRLRQVDYSGAEKFSDVLTVNGPDVSSSLSAWPVPATTILHVSARELITAAEIISPEGKLLPVAVQSKKTGEWQLDITHLQPGMYFIRVQTPGEVLSERFIRQ